MVHLYLAWKDGLEQVQVLDLPERDARAFYLLVNNVVPPEEKGLPDDTAKGEVIP